MKYLGRYIGNYDRKEVEVIEVEHVPVIGNVAVLGSEAINCMAIKEDGTFCVIDHRVLAVNYTPFAAAPDGLEKLREMRDLLTEIIALQRELSP